MPGLGTEIRENAHALAMGKIVLSLLGAAGLARYVSRGLKTYTPHTIVTRDGLDAELERVRHDGYAVDREEFDENFCCVAAPIFDPRGHFVAALGLSTTPNVFDTQRDRLAKTVMQIAAGATAEAPIKPGRVAPHSRLTPVRGHGSPSRRELASRYEKHELLAPKRSEI
jgi:acetyl-CoA synthetase